MLARVSDTLNGGAFSSVLPLDYWFCPLFLVIAFVCLCCFASVSQSIHTLGAHSRAAPSNLPLVSNNCVLFRCPQALLRSCKSPKKEPTPTLKARPPATPSTRRTCAQSASSKHRALQSQSRPPLSVSFPPRQSQVRTPRGDAWRTCPTSSPTHLFPTFLAPVVLSLSTVLSTCQSQDSDFWLNCSNQNTSVNLLAFGGIYQYFAGGIRGGYQV